MMEAVAAKAPNDPDNLRQLIAANQRMANSLGNPNYPNVGDFAGALPYIEKSVAISRRAIARVSGQRPVQAPALGGSPATPPTCFRRSSACRRRSCGGARRCRLAEALPAADPSNAAAQNDLAIGHSKIGRDLRARRQAARRAGPSTRARSTSISGSRRPIRGTSVCKLEVASDHNRLATVQAKLGERAATIENHNLAVTMSRAISAANPANIEQRIAVVLALAGRADAVALLARRRVPGSTPAADFDMAERDYAEAMSVMEGLHAKGLLHGTDLETLENGRKELARIREERAAATQR